MKKIKIPDFLRSDGIRWWQTVIPEIMKSRDKPLTDNDILNLETMATLYEFIKEAEEHLKEEGQIVEYANGIVGISKWQDIYNKNLKQYYILATEYGLTPLSEAKLNKQNQKAKEEEQEESERTLSEMIKKAL